MSDYTILICPVCHEQVEESYEYGAYCSHDQYGQVAAIQVRVQPFTASINEGIAKVQDALKEQRRKHETREAMYDWFRSLPKEERDRMEAERRSKMSPTALAMESMVRAQADDMRRLVGRQPFDWSGNHVIEISAGAAEPEGSS